MTGELERQVVLITGAGRGIGRAAAELLAQRGAAVGVVDVNADDALAVADAILAAGGRALALPADVSDRAAVLAAAERLAEQFGPLTGIVNNAMWIRYGAVEGVEEDVLDRMLAVGVKAVFWGTQALLAHGAAEGGAIVNICSPVADLGMANTASYTAVKGAIGALTRQLAVELGGRGIRVNAVTPGAVPTPGARAIVNEDGYAIRRRQTPLGRLGEEREIAAGIAFLIGPDASFVTGEILHVDGMNGGPGGNRNVTDEVIDSALRYRVQAPMIDNLMKEIGIEGGSLGRMTDVLRDAKDISSLTRDKKGKGKAGGGKDDDDDRDH